MLWETGQVIIIAFVSFLLGGIVGAVVVSWRFRKQIKEIEKKYQESVRKTYQEMGNFFGRKMKEEDLNRITNQFKAESENEKKKTSPKKPKPKKKK